MGLSDLIYKKTKTYQAKANQLDTKTEQKDINWWFLD